MLDTCEIDGWVKSGQFWIHGHWVTHPTYSDGREFYAISGMQPGYANVPEKLSDWLRMQDSHSHGLKREAIRVPGRWATRQMCEDLIREYEGPQPPYE